MKLDSLNRKKLWTSILMMLLVGTIVLSVNMIKVNEAEINTTGTYFWVSPTTNINYTSCTSFNISIRIANAPAGTYGWQLLLRFNNNTLNYTAVYYGDFLDPGGSQYSPAPVRVDGDLTLARTLLGITSVSGSGLLCKVEFHVLATGSSPLNLMDTMLVDIANPLVPVAYPNNDGFFSNVLMIHDVAVTAIGGLPAVAEQGNASQTVGFSVTVTNEGNYSESGSVTVYADTSDPRYGTGTHDPTDPDVLLVGDEIVIDTKAFGPLNPGASTPIAFTWDTAGVAGEVWHLSANASVASDDDPHDNMYIVDNAVEVVWDYDVEVEDITLNTTETKPGSGWDNLTFAQIGVRIHNRGSWWAHITVSIYAWKRVCIPCHGPTWVPYLLVRITCIWLAPRCGRVTITYNWNTAGYEGLYKISAEVDPVPGEVAPNLVDNTLEDGTVHVKVFDMHLYAIEILTPLVSAGDYGKGIPLSPGINAGLCQYAVVHFILLNEGTDTQSVNFIVNATVVGGAANGVGSPYAGKTFTIGSLIGVNVEPGYDKRLDYYCRWNTTSLHIWGTPPSMMGGLYQITGSIAPYSEGGRVYETDIGDNTRNTGLATISVIGAGDVNQDGATDVLDSLKLLVIRTVGY